MFLQTSGASAGAGTGDWYTASETSSTDRAHYIAVEVNAAMLAAGGGTVSITVNDAETAIGAAPNDEPRNTRDPTRFSLLASNRSTVISSTTVPNTAPDGTNVVFNINAVGIYYVKAETGALPISGDATVALNDDDNSYSVTVSQSGGTVGSYQSSFQQSAAGTRNFYFLVGPGTAGLYLRNFDLDGNASGVTYTRPGGGTVAGTVSGATVWNGGGSLNAGGDTINGLTMADAGVWTYQIANWTADNQTVFEANTGVGQRLVLSDTVPTGAGLFTLTPNSQIATNIGTPVNHAFSVTNQFLTSDIINFTLSGTAANYTSQLLTSTGTALTDSDGDGRLDTGILAAGATGNFILRVTPLAGAGGTDVTRVSGVSFMDTKVDAANNVTLFVDKTTTIFSSLSGFVYNDANNNAVKGAAEAGISGVNVRLTGTNDLGAAVLVNATTDVNGAYTFTGLRASNAAGYTITELTQPAAFLDGTDSAGTPGGTTGNDVISAIVLNWGVNGANNNFGEVAPSQLSGTVYRDLNNDGLIAGAGETAISGVTVALTGTNDRGAAVSLTTTTDAAGNYTFASLRPSNAAGYTITETQPAGFLDGRNTVGSQGGTTGAPPNDIIVTTAIAPGTNGTGNNFGELPPASLAGVVYLDLNNDGIQSGAGETGVNAVTLTLTGTDDLGAAVSTSTTTLASGAYAFTNLRPGTYTITETQPGALLDGRETVGSQASGTINNAANSNTISTITLSAATAATGNNFGELPPSSFAGTVYIDSNNDGVQLGATELAISGATVALTGTDDRGAAVNLTTTTNAAGAYAFGALRPGSYTLTETQPAGFLDGRNTAGTAGGTTVNNPPSDVISAITLAANVAATGYNFGELTASSLAGTVFNDNNNDGLLNGADAGLAGVTVTLTGTDDLGAAVSTTATTNATGAYAFANLRPGTYTLTETQPAAFLDGRETAGAGVTTAGTVNNTAVSNTISGIVVSSAQTGTGNNFADIAASALSGTVYIDSNNDGVQLGATETGISGVTITLTGTDDFGAAVSTTATTNGTGGYSFATLRPGTYTITETQPATFLDGRETVGTQTSGTINNAANSNTIATITLAPNVSGTANNFGELPPTSLAGTVFIDSNNDGVQLGATETGISGATITLTGTDDRGTAVNVTATSNATGAYSFINLRPGSYVVTETQPAGFLDGRNTAGTAGGTTVNNPPSDVISAITLAANVTATGYNFGELAAGSLAGTVFNDVNNDGVQQAGDNAISGVTVTLTGTDDLGAAVSTTATTNATGAYAFANLRPGTYTLTETQPAGVLDGRETAGTGTTTAGTVNNAAVSNIISGIVLASGQTGVANNFAELSSNSLAGTVYQDLNNDGVQAGATETGISGVTVTLTGTDDFGAAVSLTTTTNATGGYAFATLRPGTYTITETQPAAFLDGRETAGTQGGTVSNTVNSNTISAITLGTGTTGTANNFGELPASSFAGTVYIDSNNDGVQLGATETGINAATVTLTGTDDRGAAVNLTTTTNAAGAYAFGTLRPGSYTLTETQPAGFLDGRNTAGTAGGTTVNNPPSDIISAITLAANVAATGYNFGELSPTALSGTVYQDLNNDGLQAGAGETGISGVTVTLTGTDDLGAAVSTTATTNATGAYSFANLRPGTYTLTETQPAAFLDGKETAGAGVTTAGTVNNTAISNTISNIVVASGQTGTANNFGELPASSFAGTVYIDSNNDGVQLGATETGINAATVTLTGTDDFGAAVNLTTTTNATGAYAFGTLRPGSYVITETQPAGFLDGRNTAGTAGGTTVNNPPSDVISAITLAANVAATGYNFGELSPTSLAGTVYQDLNNDGLQAGAGETGISGVTVTLSGTNDLGTAVTATATTDGTGAYAFANLRPGTYTLTETQPAAFLDGRETAGAGVTTPGTVNNAAVSNTISNIVVASGQTGTANNFGELPASSFAGTVYIDSNNDGVQLGATETGINAATVTLTGTDDFGAAVNLTTTTNATGAYAFGTLRPGTYTITETQPAGFLDGRNTAGTAGGTTVNNPPSDVISAITLAANVAATGYNFGELSPTSLAGTVYQDLNNDGIQSGAGETGISGITVTLSGTDDLGAAVSTTATTNATGAYSFANVRPGTYTLTETQPAAFLDGRETAGAGTTTAGTVNNTAVSNTISNIVVASGQTGTANNFGELPPSSFAGTVYIDSNNDGVQLGATETGISGATVTLTGTNDFGAAVNLTTTTNGTGGYSFATLRPGSYVITETQPAGFLDGKNTAGTAGGTTVNNPPSDVISAITLASNTTATGYNFGEVQGATITGSVYLDANNDGVFQGAEIAQSGVTVTLSGTDDLGAAVSLTTTTNGAGLYTFSALRPGTYTVTETQPAGLLDGKETAGAGVTTPGTVNNAIDNNTIANITIASGQTGAANNFGELAPASLTATAYRDVNNDGVQLGAGEIGISGVTVTVTGTDDRGNAVSTALFTDGTGTVSFTNLRPGTYTITETQPVGFNDGIDSNGTPAGTLNNDQVANITVASGATGTGYKFGELPTTSISGTVYRDLNNDGLIAGAGETGISGATVTLTGTNDLGAAVTFTATTDVSGNYMFAGLRPSNAAGYTITETQPAGFLDGRNTAGSVGGTTVNNPLSDVISAVVLTAGTGATGYNFGELPPSTLSGLAFIDANNDGLFQGGETAQSGVTLTLTGTNDLGGAVTLTTTSAADGSYSFANLRPGTYTLTETQPAGLLDGREAAGTGTTTAGTVNNAAVSNTISGIVLASGQTGVANNFADLSPNSLAGIVYQDLNNDGLQAGAGETGISGVTLTLTGTDDFGATVTTTATSNATGNYTFAALRPGTYTITETQPAAFLDGKETAGTQGGTVDNTTNSNTISAITLGTATTGTANNFGELPASSFAGTVYIDSNNDGVQLGATETGINAATVTLTGTDDRGAAVNLTTTTNAAGAYSFGTLRPGSYTLTETQPAGFLDGRNTAGTAGGTTVNNPPSDIISAITLAANVAATGYNFGELSPTALSGTVYQDLNNDGLQAGAGETGIGGVTVTLSGTNDLGAAVTATATTDGTGAYSFANLRPGTYTLTETQPAAFLDGRETAGAGVTTPGTVNNAAVSNTISNIVVASGQTGTANNFGELPASSFAGTVYIDSNNDGVQLGATETGINAATVTLTGTDDFGAAVNLTTTTNATGAYAFGTLRPGTYTITETQPAGFLDGKNTSGTAGGTTVNNPPSDVISAITLAANVAATDYNFGELAGASLAGTVFNDNNDDGLLNGGDAGLSGVTVTLTGTDDLGVAVSTSTTTNGTGAYAFANLRPGTYTLTETQPAGLLDGRETAGIGTTTPGTVNNTAVSNTISGIVVGSAQTGTGNNFAELAPAALAGTVYRDLNNDGVQLGAGETGVSGVTITLTGTDDFGATVNLTTTTDAGGAYAFATLRPGTYTLTETQPAGLLDGRETVGTQTSGTIDNTTNSNTISTITLGAGVSGTANNFGELPASSFAGTVFIDANNDGAQLGAGETGISGATVTLTGTDDRGTAVSLTTLTNATGGYTFATLRPGSYVITETQPAGFLDGKNTAGTAGGTTVNNPPSDVISAITLASNTTATGYNFGELQSATISGSVYLDANNDGLFQGGETALAGVTVALTGTDDLGTAVSFTTTTDAGGAYTFAALRPGTYTLTETQPMGFLDGRETAGVGTTTPGTVNNAINSNTIASLVLASGQSGTANNFGELAPASLTATVYRDENNDGVQLGATEIGISGVTVTLTGTDDRGNAVSTTLLTDAAGNVAYTNLRPGIYTITETQPADTLDGFDSNGTPAGTLTNDQVANITVASGTLGTGYKFGELGIPAITGTVYRDLNNDGFIAGAGETGISGVTLTLTGIDDLGATVNVTTITAFDGSYAFAGLRPSSAAGYTITETQPLGFLDGLNTVGSDGGLTTNNPPSDVISAIVLPAGTGATGYNFGELPPSTLSGSTYIDANNDGLFQGGETALAGVTVTLTGTNDFGGAVTLTTTSAADGSYSFANLRPGTYTLTETQPVGFLDGRETAGTQGSGTVNNTINSNTISGITLAANTTGTANNFADLRPGVLAGAVFSDGNNDGLINGTDAGVSGATVTLTGTDDRGTPVSTTATTNAAGAYSFGTLRPGTYTISETQPAGFLDGKDTIGTPGGTTANDAFSNILLTEGTNGANNNFAELAPASLAGSVYLDANNDGVRQGGETGLAGVTVTLTGTNDLGNVISQTATSDAAGAYAFANLRPSNATGYTLTETQPAGYGDGTDAIGTPGGLAGNDVLSGIVLSAGISGTGHTFGERLESDLSVTKTDGSATYTPGTAVTYTVVVSNGGPSFVSGAVVADTLPANLSGASWTAVYAGAGSTGAASGSGDINTVIDLASGGSATYTITGTVLATATGNLVNTATVAAPAGVNDPNLGNNSATDTDTPDAQADLSITKTDGATSAVPGTAVTYTIVVSNNGPGFVTGASVADTLPAALTGVNWTALYTGAGSAGAAGGTGNISTLINLAVGGTATFTVTGTVAATATGTLVNTATVTPPTGVTDPTPGDNSATDTDALDPTADLTVTKTDGSATYLPGAAISYTVVVRNTGPSFVTGAVLTDAIPANISGATWTAVYTGTGSAGAASGSGDINTAINLASGGSATFTITGTVLSAATGNLVNTATITPPAGLTDPDGGNNSATDTDTQDTTSLAGRVFNDANNDGIPQAGENGLAGVTLTLTGTDNLGAAVNVTVTTLADGSYSFLNLRPSNAAGYTITETQPAGFLDGTDTRGTPGGIAGNDVISGIVLAQGVSGTGHNFGELAPASLAGFVYDDANNDGIRQAGENGVGGVTVTLTGTNDLGTVAPLTATTAADGSYTFGNLRPGTYVLTETQPAGFLDGTDTIGTPGGTAANDAFSNIILAAGTNGTANNFGELATAAVSGTIFDDRNNNGAFDAGDSGLAGVSVQLTGTDDLGAAVNLTTTTNAAGTYTFGTLRPGSYTIIETQPAGFLDGAETAGTLGGSVAVNDRIGAFTLPPGGSSTGNLFAELAPSSLTGTIFTDANANGLLDGGESGLAGATVTLTGTDDRGAAVSATTTTNAAGAYAFTALRPGTYTLTETQPAGLLDGQDRAGTLGGNATVNDTISAISVAPGQTGSANNFGELRPASLSGAVFDDRNSNGLVDPGENGIAGVSLTLTGTDDLGNPVNLTLTTQPDGSYSFANLRPGTYALAETTPAGFLDGTDTIGTPGGTSANDLFSNLVVSEGTVGTANNFAELAPATLRGSVFTDADNDGVFDPAETGLGGVIVTLTGTDDRGNPVSVTVTTLADGSYVFNGLRPSDATGYALTETQPAGLLDGRNAVGTAGGTTVNNPPSDLISGIVTTAGATPTGYNFGELRPATLSGAVFQDDSNDGTQQPGEPGVAGVTVTLTGTNDLGATVNVTVTTLADGSYSFGNLRPGTYALTETQPAGVLDGRDTLGTAGGTLTNDRASAITLAEGQTGSGYTFAELAGSSFTGTVFGDLNNNGAIDPGENGLAGVTLTLTGTDDLGAAVSVLTTSAADGSYTFGNLRPGSYVLTETQPAGFLDGQNTAGTAGGTTVNNPPSDVISAITLPANTAATGYLFGELAPASFSGTVFQDLDDNGTNDPTDLPLAGATVTLTGTDDLGNAVNTSVTSAADGSFTFASLRPGTYTLTETQPAGYFDGTDTAGTTGGTPANDSFSGIVLAVGQTGGGYLFGERTAPDLVVTKTDGTTSAQPGDQLTYIITVANASAQQAAGVTVTDQLPSVLEFVSASNGGTFDPLTGVITWNLGSIAGANAQTITLTVVARVPANVPRSVGSVTNTVTAVDVSGVDGNPANNTASDSDRLPAPADLYVAITDRLTTARVGQQTTYTITGGNAGGQPAEGVIVSEALPPGVRFVSASNGGQLINGRVVWNLGDLAPGETFQLTVRVLVQSGAGGKNLIASATIADRFGSPDDVTPADNSATDRTRIPLFPGVPFFAFDAFHNFGTRSETPLLPSLTPLDVTRPALLPLAPIYSGEADPGSTLVVTLFNAKGEQIGSETVTTDAGGNWLASFPSSTVKDVPNSVTITQLSASYSLGDTTGHNLRTYFSPALNPGHFFLSASGSGLGTESAPLLRGLGLENPLQLGTVKYGGDFLGSQATASGY